MAEPVIARIIDAIETALNGITTGNGYAVQTSGVVRPTRRGLNAAPADNGIILTAEGGDEAEQHSLPGNPPAQARTQEFRAIWVIRESPAVTEAFDARAFRCLAAMAQAIMADPQWGGLAIDTKTGRDQPVSADDGSFDGVELAFSVTYRHKENDWTSSQ